MQTSCTALGHCEWRSFHQVLVGIHQVLYRRRGSSAEQEQQQQNRRQGDSCASQQSAGNGHGFRRWWSRVTEDKTFQKNPIPPRQTTERRNRTVLSRIFFYSRRLLMSDNVQIILLRVAIRLGWYGSINIIIIWYNLLRNTSIT